MKYYEYTATVQRQQDDGTQKAQTEKLLVTDEALLAAVTKAEAMYLGQGEYETTGCALTKFADIIGTPAEHIFEAKVQFITIDEATHKERKTSMIYATWADNFDEAKTRVSEFMLRGISEFRIVSIKETRYIDIIS